MIFHPLSNFGKLVIQDNEECIPILFYHFIINSFLPPIFIKYIFSCFGIMLKMIYPLPDDSHNANQFICCFITLYFV